MSRFVAPRVGGHTPWGPAQYVKTLAEGVYLVHTAGHGGVKVDPERLALLPASVRKASPGVWFEEDCEAALPLFFLGVPDTDAAACIRTIKHYYPEVWS